MDTLFMDLLEKKYVRSLKDEASNTIHVSLSFLFHVGHDKLIIAAEIF